MICEACGGHGIISSVPCGPGAEYVECHVCWGLGDVLDGDVQPQTPILPAEWQEPPQLDTGLQDGMLSHYIEQAKASDINVEARIAREPFFYRGMMATNPTPRARE